MGDFIEELLNEVLRDEKKGKGRGGADYLASGNRKERFRGEGLRPTFVKKGTFEFHATTLQVEWDEAFIPGACICNPLFIPV